MFGTAPRPAEEDDETEGSSSSGGAGSSSGTSADSGTALPCPALRAMPLGASFGTAKIAGGSTLDTAEGNKLGVDATTSIAYERVVAVRSECPFELGLDTTGFATTNGFFVDLVWIDYETAIGFGSVEIGGYSPTYDDADDTFAMVRNACDQNGCLGEYADDVVVNGAAVFVRFPLAGGGIPSLEVAGMPHADPKLILPPEPITKLTVHVGLRSIDAVEGTITYRSVSASAQ